MAKEHSIFISYRQADGSDLATWIFGRINRTSLNITEAERAVLTCQIDQAIPGGFNWKKYLDHELKNADSLIIVCSPAGMNRYLHKYDYYYHELEWWIANRMDRPPILVSIKKHGHEYVPIPVLNAWENLQVVQIDSFLLKLEANDTNKDVNIFLESVFRGIQEPLGYVGKNINTPKHEFCLPNIDGVFAWEKDWHGKYIYANELYARAAGFDSPYALLGKTDDKMPWRSLAEKFREGDRLIMTGNELSRMGVFEKEIMVDKTADILVNEGVIRDHSNRIIGVRGCFIDVTAGLSQLFHRDIKMDETGIYLGPKFDNQHIDNSELQVLKGLINLVSKEKMAIIEKKSIKEINSTITSLRKKLQCSREQDILATVIRAGLPLQLLIAD